MPSGGPTPCFKAVLFDLDGTLIEFKFKVKEARAAMIDLLRHEGFKVTSANDETKTQHIIDLAMKEWQESDKLALHDFSKMKEELSLVLEKYELAGFEEAHPHEGSMQLLKRLNESGVTCGVVTNSGRKPVDWALQMFGFTQYLSLVITRNDVEKLKPQPEGILRAMKLLDVGLDETIYVGDSTIDLAAAKSAGIRCIALSLGMYESEVLAKEKPDYMVQRIEDVARIVFGE